MNDQGECFCSAEVECLRQNNIFENIEKKCVTYGTITVLLLNARLMNNDAFCFTETQVQHQHSLNGIKQDFENFSIFLKNNDNLWISERHHFNHTGGFTWCVNL